MAHHNALFSQILKWVPRHEFEALAREHHTRRAFRRAPRWSQFAISGLVAPRWIPCVIAAAIVLASTQSQVACATEHSVPNSNATAWHYSEPGEMAVGESEPDEMAVNEKEFAVPTEDFAVPTEDEEIIDPDAPPRTPNPITPTLFYGGQIEFQAEVESNFDLDDDEGDDLVEIEPELQLAFSYVPKDWLLAYANFELSREFAPVEEGRDDERDIELVLRHAYVLASDVFADGISMQLGRQRFKDDRRWLFNRVLDAGRLRYSVGDLDLEIAAARRALLRRNFFEDDRTDRINTYIAYGQYEVAKDIDFAAYTIFRDDRSERFGQPIWVGLRSLGVADVFDDEIEYWIDVANVRGDDNGTDINGYGFDVGATYKFDLPLMPYIYLGYASGSGDPDPETGDDKAFRQTRLEGNSDRFGGVTRFDYYGVALDPKLSNLHIITAGIGFRPTRKSSIDLVYHSYRQDEFSDELRSALDLDPNEDAMRMSKSLGSELDVIIGYRDILPNVDVDFAFGYFFTGDAFRVEVDDDVFIEADDAFFGTLEVEVNF